MPLKINTWMMIGLMLGSILGPGLFELPGQLAGKGNAWVQMLAWIWVSLGVKALSQLMHNLSLNSGQGPGGWPQLQNRFSQSLGRMPSLLLAWGYWCSAWIGNLAYHQMAWGVICWIGAPCLDRVPTWVGVSILIWICHALSSHRGGVAQAALWNAALTGAKLLLVAVVALSLLQRLTWANFQSHWRFMDEHHDWSATALDFIQATLAMTWLFVGFEGSLLLGHRAEDPQSVRRAQSWGLSSVSLIYIAIWGLTLGAAPSGAWGSSSQQSIFSQVSKAWGDTAGWIFQAVFFLFLLGALLSWTLFAGELASTAMEERKFPGAYIWSRLWRTQPSFQRGIALTSWASQVGALLSAALSWDYGWLASVATLTTLPNYFAVLWLLGRPSSSQAWKIHLCAGLYLLGLTGGSSLWGLGAGGAILVLGWFLEQPFFKFSTPSKVR